MHSNMNVKKIAYLSFFKCVQICFTEVCPDHFLDDEKRF